MTTFEGHERENTGEKKGERGWYHTHCTYTIYSPKKKKTGVNGPGGKGKGRKEPYPNEGFGNSV